MAASGGSDQELVDGVRRGDTAAWEELYRRAHPGLVAYARRRLPAEEHASEAVAEAMVRAVSGGIGFRNDGAGPEAWLYGILRHVVLDAQRRHARPVPVSPAVREELAADPAEYQQEAEERAAMRAAFGRLGRSDQELLELRVVAGLPAEEVAGILGRTPAAVRMAQSRALGRLRRLLDAQAFGGTEGGEARDWA